MTTSYAPMPLKTARLADGEQQIHSCVIHPYVYEKQGGFFLKISAWYPENTRFYLHLTDQRIIVEPYEWTKGEMIFSTGLLALTTLVVPSPVDHQLAAEAKLGQRQGMNKMRAMHGNFAEIPYSEIARAETFRQGLVKLVRLRFKDPAAREMVFSPAKTPELIAETINVRVA
jgi:hypothetical protein